MSYLPCELHCHTVHSDGDFEVCALQEAAKENGLALIALTDHNTFSGCDELDDGILPTIHGIEWTTYFGHMLVLGADTFVDWRDAVAENIDDKIREVKAAGGLVGVAHPYQLGSPMCTGGRWEFKVRDWTQVDYIEIMHTKCFFDTDENKRSLALWTKLLDGGYHLAATYGKDWHRPVEGHFGCTYLDIDGAVNAQNALAAIQAGRTVVSEGAKFFFTVTQNGQTYRIGDTLSAGDAVFSVFFDRYARHAQARINDMVYTHIRLVTNANECAATLTPTEKSFALTLQKHRWYRAELWGRANGKEALLAVTSPVYTE